MFVSTGRGYSSFATIHVVNRHLKIAVRHGIPPQGGALVLLLGHSTATDATVLGGSILVNLRKMADIFVFFCWKRTEKCNV
jgi:hypothetical protein